MGDPNWPNRTLFHHDNLAVLRGMDSATVDLIATDPPFNKNRDFHATPDSLAKGAKFQDRWSWERDVLQDWVDQITDDYPRLMEAIESARYAHSDGMGAFMCFMAVRLLEMRRVLKPTGSIYLHCDDAASHYLKAVMDAIFGWKNFRNEIIWERSAGRSDAKSYARVHDGILYYGKSEDVVWNQQYDPLTQDYIDQNYRYRDEQGRYTTMPLKGGGVSGQTHEFTWRGVHAPNWRFTVKSLERLEADGLIHWSRKGQPRRKFYLSESRGVAARDLIIDIARAPKAERTGYPTQKPLALYERLIRASTVDNDTVLDPFAGCATTCVAAERLGRRWAGIDIWEKAHEVVLDRLEVEGLTFGDIHYATEPPARTDSGEITAPFLRVTERRKRPPLEPWRKLSRAQIVQELTEAQTITDGLVLCAGCGRELEAPFMELDHVKPRVDGGENDISNRILLCRPCNGRKNANLTMRGLIAANRKADWMKAERLAKHAQELAQERYEDVRYRRRWPVAVEPSLETHSVE